MALTGKIKSVDFFRKIPRDLTEASLSGAGLSIVAAFSMLFLFGMELQNYLTMSTTTSVIVDQSSDSEFLLIGFNMSFPALSCEFASVDVSDVLGTNRLNVTKTIRKYSINKELQTKGPEIDPTPISTIIKHDDKIDEEHVEGSVTLGSKNFDEISHRHPILVVNFFAPWCYWSNRLKPSWEKAANIIRERHNPETDGRIIMGKVDCTKETHLCKRTHIQAYPSIRIFRKGSDIRDTQKHHNHESYYGDRDTDSLVKDAVVTHDKTGLSRATSMMKMRRAFMSFSQTRDRELVSSYLIEWDKKNAMEQLVEHIDLQSNNSSLEENHDKATPKAKRPAPREGGCRIEGFVRVKKVPGNIIISARSESHSFDASQMNMSHVISSFTFGKKVTPKMMSDLKRLRPYIENHDKLTGNSYINVDHHTNVTIEHYLQVVKTEVMSASHQLIEDYEYTTHSSLVHALTIPVAKFHFEPSPMQILITETPKSFPHFITNVCAIIGGVFTVAGIMDSLLYNTMRLVKKIELGKNF